MPYNGIQKPMGILKVENPPNPWSTTHVEYLGEPPRATLEVYEDSTRTILACNDSPDIPFRWSLNPYRGCQHGCAYCYARPSHEWLGFGAGTDFERKIVVKPRAPELLRETFEKRSWKGEMIAFSGDTDCYQPLEASWGLTRRCLEVCLEYRNPVDVVTKSALVQRDAGILAGLAEEASCRVSISIAFLDEERGRAIETFAPAPRLRLRAMEVLADAGVPVGVMVSPVIPGLNDQEIPSVLKAAREAGARWACLTALRLPGNVQSIFLAALERNLPRRARRVEARIREIHGGELDEARFGKRMTGEGTYWEGIEDLFGVWHRKLGYATVASEVRPKTFRRPGEARQRGLPFDAARFDIIPPKRYG